MEKQEDMKALVACEYSGRVRDALTKLGWDAISCDMLPSDIPGNHYMGDVRDILYDEWDLIIAFPPCTHLASSGARYFKEKIADGRQQKAIDFFMLFADHPCKHVAIENPVGIMSSIWRKPDQIIQPWQFGHPESKRTCLWLKSLPMLVPTNVLSLPECGHWQNQMDNRQNRIINNNEIIAWNDPRIALLRSKTYLGIAKAMAEQWTKFVKEHSNF